MLRLVSRLGGVGLLTVVTVVVAAGSARAPDRLQLDQAATAARAAVEAAQRSRLSPAPRALMEDAAEASARDGMRVPLKLPDAAAQPPLAGLNELGTDARPWQDGNAPPMVVLVSFSMPEPTLRELARQAARLGVPLVLRGLVDDSLEATAQRMRAYQDIADSGFAIDPTLFSRFQVDAVPSYLLLLEPLQACSARNCPAPKHVRVAGEAGLDHVLETMRRSSREPGARDAAAALLTRLARRP